MGRTRVNKPTHLIRVAKHVCMSKLVCMPAKLSIAKGALTITTSARSTLIRRSDVQRRRQTQRQPKAALKMKGKRSGSTSLSTKALSG